LSISFQVLIGTLRENSLSISGNAKGLMTSDGNGNLPKWELWKFSGKFPEIFHMVGNLGNHDLWKPCWKSSEIFGNLHFGCNTHEKCILHCFQSFKSPRDLSRPHVFWRRSTFEWFLKFRETKNNLGRTFLVLICIFDMNIVSIFECLKIRCLRPQCKSEDRLLGFRRAARYSRGLVYTLFNRNLQFSVSECVILLTTEIFQCVHYWVHPPNMFGNAIF